MAVNRFALLLGLLGCVSHATSAPTPKPRAIALADEWPRQPDGRDIVARTPAGPFASLAAVCVALGRRESDQPFEGCHWAENDTLGGGPFVRIGTVSTWEPVAHENDQPSRIEDIAIQTRAGWYVLPRIADTGNRYSSFAVEGERAGNGLLLHYTYDLATAGRFASTTEHGVIACEVTDTVACTPKVPTAMYDQRMDTSKQDWPSTVDVQLACTASFAHHAITLAPMSKPEGSDPTWTAAAAATCRGTRAVTARAERGSAKP